MSSHDRVQTERRLRILIAAPEFPPATGGMEVHADQTARGLAARGHHVVVLTVPRPGATPDPGGVSVRPLLRARSAASPGRLLRLCVKEQAEVVLLMNAGLSRLGLVPAARRPPVIVRTAGNDAYGAWHGPHLPLRFLYWRLPHRDPRSLGARLRRIDQQRRVAAVLEGLAACERILCNSSYSRARLLALGVPADRLRAVVGGVDTECFRPVASSGRREDHAPPVLGIAARLKPIKGIDVALRALALLHARGCAARLRIAGNGPEEPQLRSLARSLGVAQAVEFAGDVAAEAMPDFFRALDLYLQPSVEVRHEASGISQEETMGRALLEAGASGVPVVASRTGGIADVVADGVSGRLVPPGDAVALADAAQAVLSAADRGRSLGAGGRSRALERFGWGAIVLQTERHLLEVTRDAPRRDPAHAKTRTGS